MKFTKEQLNLEEGLTKEWIITNGIGGFASSTIIGANTRKYHGLLIAPLTPPARRFMVLSKVDESIVINGKEHCLYTNICKNYISKGFTNQTSFEKDYIPTFEYEVEKTKIEKKICMEHGRNTVGIYYKIKNRNKKATFLLSPIVNFRDFHQTATDYEFNISQKQEKRKIKMVVNNNSYSPMYMRCSEGEYEQYDKNIFKGMFYIEEQKRGFISEEDHIVPGTFKIEIEPNEEKEISFTFSLEENIDELNVKQLINNEIIRLNRLFKKSELIKTEKEDYIKKYLIAADNFIVYRPSFRLHTIIAGYHWFLDWGRDSLISFEGLLLITKRYDIAKDVLKTITRDIKYGLVPNGYSGFDNRPLYNSVDASLLLFEQIEKYIKYTNDYKFVESIYPKLELIIENYIKGIDVDNNNIYLDTDGLIVSGTETTQNTWMDVKIGDEAVTPRNGKVVEINSLWYNALMIMKTLSYKFGKRKESNNYKKLAQKCKFAFEESFYNKEKKCLYDVLGDSKIRPNQLFSMSLTHQIIDPTSNIGKNVLKTVEKELLNSYGLQTLSSDDPKYVAVYEGDGEKRDRSYHQGITWTWLLGLYYNTLKNTIKATKNKEEKNKLKQKLDKFVKNTMKTFDKEINENGCIGSIAEIYDSKEPQMPKGTVAQAWSLAEVLRIILNK